MQKTQRQDPAHPASGVSSQRGDSWSPGDLPGPLVFLLLSDGTMAWTNATASGERAEQIVGQQLWRVCHESEQSAVRDAFVGAMVQREDFQGVVRGERGRRFLVSMHPLPTMQPSQHAVVGLARPLTDEADTLTPREREVLALVCDEFSTPHIAKRLHISPATVETHRQNIARKLGARTVVGQVRAAIRAGLLEP